MLNLHLLTYFFNFNNYFIKTIQHKIHYGKIKSLIIETNRIKFFIFESSQINHERFCRLKRMASISYTEKSCHGACWLSGVNCRNFSMERRSSERFAIIFVKIKNSCWLIISWCFILLDQIERCLWCWSFKSFFR